MPKKPKKAMKQLSTKPGETTILQRPPPQRLVHTLLSSHLEVISYKSSIMLTAHLDLNLPECSHVTHRLPSLRLPAAVYIKSKGC